MTLTPSTETAQRRIVLIDFDWPDADLLPELLRHPGFSVRLVAGARADDAGLRVAELCGLPRTLDLADLTREIFDVALVGESSPRRTQLEGLMLALGTPCLTPQSFVTDAERALAMGPAIEAPMALHAAALEEALGGHPLDEIVERALPDFAGAGPTTPLPVVTNGERSLPPIDLHAFPSPADRRGLEETLRSLVVHTGAQVAQLHTASDGDLQCVASVGGEDPLLRGLVDLAVKLNAPQVVSTVSGPQPGRAWGAWPFRTTQRRGVLAAGGIDPGSGWTQWEHMVIDLRTTWDERDRIQSAPAFPMVPNLRLGFLDLEDFRARLELAIERHARDGLRFEAHRLRFSDGESLVGPWCVRLPEHLRDTDCLTRPAPLEVVLLVAGAAGQFTHMRRRLLALWGEMWEASGAPAPAPSISDEQVVLESTTGAVGFVAAAGEWLSRH